MMIFCILTSILHLSGGELEDERGDGPRDVDGASHGAGRVLQELRRQAGLDVRVRHGDQPEIQRGQSYTGAGSGPGVQRD